MCVCEILTIALFDGAYLWHPEVCIDQSHTCTCSPRTLSSPRLVPPCQGSSSQEIGSNLAGAGQTGFRDSSESGSGVEV